MAGTMTARTLTLRGWAMTGTAAALLGALAVLGACDNGPSAVAKGEQQAAGTQMASADASARTGSPEADHRQDPVPQVDGRPMWSASKRYSAEESARRNFERNGADFGAGTVEQFVEKAHAFVENPPKGAQTLKRANGDVLIYDPKGNVFAVRTKDGAPRTMFKPDKGGAYWAEQKARETARADRSKGGDDSEA